MWVSDVKVWVLDKVGCLSSWLSHFWTLHIFYIDAWLPDGRLAAVCACEADARGPIEHLEQLHWGLTLFPMSQWCTFKTDLLVKLQIFHFCQVEWFFFSPLLKNENFSSVLTELRSFFRLFLGILMKLVDFYCKSHSNKQQLLLVNLHPGWGWWVTSQHAPKFYFL